MLTYEEALKLKKDDILYWRRHNGAIGGDEIVEVRVYEVYRYKRKPACKVKVFMHEWTVTEGHDHPKLFTTNPNADSPAKVRRLDDEKFNYNNTLPPRYPRNTAPK